MLHDRTLEFLHIVGAVCDAESAPHLVSDVGPQLLRQAAPHVEGLQDERDGCGPLVLDRQRACGGAGGLRTRNGLVDDEDVNAALRQMPRRGRAHHAGAEDAHLRLLSHGLLTRMPACAEAWRTSDDSA